jgi:hypothetical protein
MEFQGKGIPLSQEGFQKALDLLGLNADPAALWAVIKVKTSGFGFLKDRRPLILFERHVFSKQTNHKFDATHPDISNEERGGYLGKEKEYGRLNVAMGLDREAALKSASWGLGQVMGFNFKSAGFDNVESMVKAMVPAEDAQLLGMANFIRKAKAMINGREVMAVDALKNRHWDDFAYIYNGFGFSQEYTRRLRQFYNEYSVKLPDLHIRKAQAALTYLGYDPRGIDGIQGKNTSSALKAFQKDSNLPQTGNNDEATQSKLFAKAFPD